MAGNIYREMARCETCKAWWSIGGDNIIDRCPCGGELRIVNMEEHIAGLPYKPYGGSNGETKEKP